MQNFHDLSNSTPRVQKFLDLIDFVAETKGLNVPQVQAQFAIA